MFISEKLGATNVHQVSPMLTSVGRSNFLLVVVAGRRVAVAADVFRLGSYDGEQTVVLWRQHDVVDERVVIVDHCVVVPVRAGNKNDFRLFFHFLDHAFSLPDKILLGRSK